MGYLIATLLPWIVLYLIVVHALHKADAWYDPRPTHKESEADYEPEDIFFDFDR